MDQARWGYVIFLLVFIGISWGVRVILSHRVTEKVLDEENSGEE